MSKTTLAIKGGPPVLATGDLPWPITTQSVRDAVNQALDDGSWGHYDSPLTENLVEQIKLFFAAENAMLCSSGTVAVELALRGAGVRAGDEVVLAGYDFPGNFRAIESLSAHPVLVDVVENGWVIEPEHLENGISEKTTAVIVSHLHGQTADIATIRSIINSRNDRRENQILIVEDACQVPGGQSTDGPLGSLGDVAAFSFGGSKLLSAGRGGAIVSDNADILQRAKIYSQRGNDAFPLSQLQAAALLPQFDSLGDMTIQRLAGARKLIEATAQFDELVSLDQVVAETTPAFYKVPWLLKDRTPGWTRLDFIQAMKAEGVPVGEGFRGFLRRSPRRCRKVGSLVNSQIAAQQSVLLHHPILLQDSSTLDLVIQAFEKVLSQPN